MEEVTTVSTTAVGDSNHIPSTLDSTNENSAATATVAGDREDKVNSGNGHESNEDDVSKRSKDRKDKDRSRSRSRSKDRDSGSRKHKRRHRSRDRDKDRDDVDGDKEKKSSRRDRHRDKDRDRDRHRRSSRSRDRDRHRDRSRDRDRRRDRDRDRDRDRRDRDRDRDRRRSRSTSSERRERRRREDRERDRSEERREERRRERQAERERKEKEDEASGRITLRDVITHNPGISVPDALQRMHAINTAMASGTTVPPLVVPVGQPAAPVTMNHALGVAPQAGIAGPAMVQQQFAATKSQREIYVGNIPPQITIPQLTEFVNEAMKQLGLAQPSAFGGPVVTCWISTDAHYAFIELRTIEEAQAALTGLSGVSCAGYQLRVGRPKTPGGGGGGGVPQQQLGLGGLQPLGGGLGQVLGGGLGAGGLAPPTPVEPASNVLMVANLPDVIGEEQVRELLAPFGAIKLFNFIKVPMNGGTGGAAVLEYEDPSVGEGAITGLNGLPVGDKQLSVQRVPANMAALLLKPAATPSVPAPTSAPVATTTTETKEDNDPLLASPPTAVIRMSNMTNLNELRDDEIYEELQEDIADECNAHGTVRSLAIPRPTSDCAENDPGAGVGEVFVCFTHADGAEKAKQAVHGRTFNGLRVKAVFYPEELFHAKVYALPEGFIVGRGAVAEEDNMD